MESHSQRQGKTQRIKGGSQLKFQELRERMVKGVKTNRYLENPSTNELIGLAKRANSKSIRLLFNPETNDLYAWDGYDMIHDEFAMQELFMDSHQVNKLYPQGDPRDLAYINWTGRTVEGTFIGNNLNIPKIDKLLEFIEEYENGTYVEDEYSEIRNAVALLFKRK